VADRNRLVTRNTDGVIANLRQYGGRVRQRVVQANVATLEEAYNIAQSLCAYDEQQLDDFHMIEVMRAELSPEGLAWMLGFFAEDFRAAGQPFYAPYVEYGTTRQAAQPSIGPATEQVAPRHRRRLREALRYP
jgi:hypothetical protein